MGRARDFTNQTIGQLTPLYIDETKPRGAGKNIYWICQCSCGNLISVNSCNLNSGIKVGRNMSCGKCYAQRKNLIGLTFGKLKVLSVDEEYEKIKKSGDWHNKWLCRCECGNTVSVFGSNLTRLHTTSCGCSARSIGEENIERVLRENNIKYAREYTFSDLKNKGKLRFDFAIFTDDNTLSHLIEFDGRQHFNEYQPWNSSETLEERQARDELKNMYCRDNGINLIRISYDKRDNITLKDLGL